MACGENGGREVRGESVPREGEIEKLRWVKADERKSDVRTDTYAASTKLICATKIKRKSPKSSIIVTGRKR